MVVGDESVGRTVAEKPRHKLRMASGLSCSLLPTQCQRRIQDGKAAKRQKKIGRDIPGIQTLGQP